MNEDRAGMLLTALLTFGVGSILLALAVILWRRTRSFLAVAVDADGTIINLATVRTSSGTGYRAIVEFDTHDGRRVRWRDKVTSDPPVGQCGERLPMKYDPANPQNARINLPSRLWSAPRSLGGLATLLFGVGICFAVIAVFFYD